jgi:hypothetical protein
MTDLRDNEKLYGDRDPVAQGDHFVRHMHHMTTENLHSKAAIAEELAHRDIALEQKDAELKERREQVEDHQQRDDETIVALSRGAILPSEIPATVKALREEYGEMNLECIAKDAEIARLRKIKSAAKQLRKLDKPAKVTDDFWHAWHILGDALQEPG